MAIKLRRAPGSPYASIEEYKASPAYADQMSAIDGFTPGVIDVVCKYKLLNGDIWVQYTFADSELDAWKAYIVTTDYDMGVSSNQLGFDAAELDPVPGWTE